MIIFGVLIVFLGVKLRESGKLQKSHLTKKLVSSLDRLPTLKNRDCGVLNRNDGGAGANDDRKSNQWSSSSSSGNSGSRLSFSLSTTKSSSGTHLAPPVDSSIAAIMCAPAPTKKDPEQISLKTLLDGRSQDGDSVEPHKSNGGELPKNVPGDSAPDRLDPNCDNVSRQTQSTSHQARSSDISSTSFDLEESAATRTSLTETAGLRFGGYHSGESSGIWWRFTEAFGALVANNHNDDNKFRLATMEAALSTVVTVSTLVGCRHESASSQPASRNFCCLEHEIQVSCSK